MTSVTMSNATKTRKTLPRRGIIIGALSAAMLLLAGCHVYGHRAGPPPGQGHGATTHGNGPYYNYGTGYDDGYNRNKRRQQRRKRSRRGH